MPKAAEVDYCNSRGFNPCELRGKFLHFLLRRDENLDIHIYTFSYFTAKHDCVQGTHDFKIQYILPVSRLVQSCALLKNL